MSSQMYNGRELVLTCRSVATLSNLVASLFGLEGVQISLRIVHKCFAHVPIPFPHVSIV